MGVEAVAMATKFRQKQHFSVLCEKNLNKNQTKLHWLQFCARNRGIFHTNSKVFGVGEFKYAIQNFNLAKGVAMATKYRHKYAKIAL